MLRNLLLDRDHPFFAHLFVTERFYLQCGYAPWACLAGRMFFDIKPDGAFWLCQDVPTNLNLQDPKFLDKWCALDCRGLAGTCPGCPYSCYVLSQMSFNLSNAATWFRYAKKL
jgi:MoaA/NifB/PqqE/SkfB family radical SAM enzyme